MWLKLLEIVIKIIAPKMEDGTMRFGIRHTATAAIVLGAFNLYALNTLVFTRADAVKYMAQNDIEMRAVKKDLENTKIMAIKAFQQGADHWDEVKARLDELNRHLRSIEEARRNAKLITRLHESEGG